MLETRIEELTAAVVALTKAIQGMPTTEVKLYPNGPADGQTEKSVNKSAATEKATSSEAVNTARKTDEVPNDKPQGTQKSKPISDTSKPSSPESQPVGYDDVKKATNAVSAKLGREKAVAGLARFGVQSAMKLTEEQWPEYVAYMTRVAAGEIDPEDGE